MISVWGVALIVSNQVRPRPAKNGMFDMQCNLHAHSVVSDTAEVVVVCGLIFHRGQGYQKLRGEAGPGGAV